jgi:hypothetical protein
MEEFLRKAVAGGDRRPLYRALLGAQFWLRAPEPVRFALSNGEMRVLALFSDEQACLSFWQGIDPGRPVQAVPYPFQEAARLAQQVGGAVIEPGHPAAPAGLLIPPVDLALLAAGEVPGELTAWLASSERIGRNPGELVQRLRESLVWGLVGPGPEGEPRLYLLAKSDDGTMAVPVFSGPEALASFREVRRLGDEFRATLLEGARAVRIAREMGAVLLADPESPWEAEVEPTYLWAN